ncbi:hypothetical protein Ahy_A07g037369 isoform B [Arachis hypogaea]|uniref:Glycosyl transferase family 1 domain-containing protein n=1 Tax=Arachis hypogaea TaxID=3818 RepID=A0A445CIK6_ARAHY|nr:hypothetical protein Ahy_A07g037369 isoform B [Arachis hypogaea]
MEEMNNRGEFVAKSSLRSAASFKSTLSGRSSPRNSPTFRRLNSSRTPRRDGRTSVGGALWLRSNRVLLWLLLITLWAYLGFFVQSRWAHSDKKEEFSGFGGRSHDIDSDAEQSQRRDLIATDNSISAMNETFRNEEWNDKSVNVALAKKEEGSAPSGRKTNSKKKSKRSARSSRGKARGRRKTKSEVENNDAEEQEAEIPNTNSTYGLLVGPFGSIEDRILEWSPEKRSGTCNRKGDFARLVWSRRFILIFHELSMTGAPLSMMELATELLSCGATVSAVVLSKKGGLMPELTRRRIKVLEDKADFSFKTAMKADLVIAGSAVCASWIEQYIEHFPAGASQVAWWIMENRREYFDRSKDVLNRVKMLVFLSESQSKQWQKWCEEESIKLRSHPELVPLSVNDELAFVAGLPSTLNTPSFSTEKMTEKRQLLRDLVRKEMGLTENDMLVISLSSINPGKGQLLLLESAISVIEEPRQLPDDKKMRKLNIREGLSTLARRRRIRKMLPPLKDGDAVLSSNQGTMEQSLKVLIGSVGSKSNKADYVKGLLNFLQQHPNSSKSVLWTPATTRVASLYSAADVYVINAQGLGETFGRVTIEAMAFGLPVLGTDAGGTKEIVENNVTGLLHPIGHQGNQVLAQNLQFLLKNQLARKQMGIEGRKKVQSMYMKQHMYKKFVEFRGLAEAVALANPTYAVAIYNIIPGLTLLLAISFRLESGNLGTSAGKPRVLGTLDGIGGPMILTFYKGSGAVWSSMGYDNVVRTFERTTLCFHFQSPPSCSHGSSWLSQFGKDQLTKGSLQVEPLEIIATNDYDITDNLDKKENKFQFSKETRTQNQFDFSGLDNLAQLLLFKSNKKPICGCPKPLDPINNNAPSRASIYETLRISSGTFTTVCHVSRFKTTTSPSRQMNNSSSPPSTQVLGQVPASKNSSSTGLH